MSGGMIVGEICALCDLELIAEEWLALAQNCPEATPFQSPDWLIPWWRRLPQGDLWVLTFRKEEKLLGVAPLFIRDKQVMLMGVGVSDYLGVVYEPSARFEVAAALARHLQSACNCWDECHFQQLRSGSLLQEMAAPEACVSHLLEQEKCPMLNIGGKLRNIRSYVPATMVRKLEYYRRRLTRLGSWAGTIQ